MCDFSYNLNLVYFQRNDTMRAMAVDFLLTNYDWVLSRTQANSSAYWSQVCFVFFAHGRLAPVCITAHPADSCIPWCGA
jgi:hypothetical protein